MGLRGFKRGLLKYEPDDVPPDIRAMLPRPEIADDPNPGVGWGSESDRRSDSCGSGPRQSGTSRRTSP